MGCDYYVCVNLPLKIERITTIKQRQSMVHAPGKHMWGSDGDTPAFNADGTPIMENYNEIITTVSYKGKELKSPDPKLRPWEYVEVANIILPMSYQGGTSTLWLSMDNYSIGFNDESFTWPEMEAARALLITSIKELFGIDADEKDVIVSVYTSC